MKQITIYLILIIIAALLTLSLYFYAQETVSPSILSGGGGISGNSTYFVEGTLGQPAADTMTGSNYSIQGGYWQQLSTTVLLPDLAGYYIAFSDDDNLQRGSDYTIKYSIMNLGAVPTDGTFYVTFYISPDAVIDTTDTYLGISSVDTVLPSGSATDTLAVSVTIPDTTSNGSYYLGMICDTENAISEISETNNTFSSPSGTTIIPVELTGFNFSLGENGKVHLFWTTASETNNLGFEIERSNDGALYVKIGFVRGHGTASASNDYSFTPFSSSTTIGCLFAYSSFLKA